MIFFYLAFHVHEFRTSRIGNTGFRVRKRAGRTIKRIKINADKKVNTSFESSYARADTSADVGRKRGSGNWLPGEVI